MKRASSKELVFPGQRLCKSWWNHMIFRAFRMAIWLVCLFRVFFTAIDNYLGMIESMQIAWVIILGNTLLTLGFAATIAIHYQMGSHWRSGIDPTGPSKIISSGAYQYSRNPMFLSVAIAQLGFFLALPSIFSLICLAVGLYTLYRQVIVEEQHLWQVLPNEYKNYCSNVRRWL